MHQAIAFLTAFSQSKFTLAHYNGKSMHSFPCNPNRLQDAIKLLITHNEKNQDIYFMVNEGNGVLNEKRTACHSTENVINLSAVFLDAEIPNSDPMPSIEAFCKSYFISPSLVVATSPYRYHCYWLLEHTEATPENITKWKQIQALLHSKLSVDRTMTDIPQVLRVPGFMHTSKDFKVNLLSRNDIRFSLDYLYDKLSKHFALNTFTAFQPLKTVTEEYKVPEGERHEELLRRARKLYTLPLTDAEVKCFIDGFISNHVDNNEDFRPGKKRYGEVERILSAAKTYADKERLEHASKIIQSVQSKKTTNAFELDPEFYYNAPGLVGDITRHIVDTSDYPIPAHAFAAAASLVGFTKARYVQGYRQLPPLNYFLCLAPSGSGKTTIQDVIKEAFKKLQIQHLLEDGIASAQGLIKFISDSHNLGFIMYDEVKDLFQTISHKNASSYEVKISLELTKLYTAYKSTYTPPTTKTHKGTKIILEKPLFSFLGYGHNTLIDQLFTKNNVMEGLLPRFIILNVGSRTEKPSIYKSIPQKIIDELFQHVTNSNLAVEQIADNHDIKIAPVEKSKIISLSRNTQNLFDDFKNNCSSLYNDAVQEKNGLEALFSRGVEQSLRLSLAMSDNEIQPIVFDFCKTLIHSQMMAFYNSFSTSVNQTETSKEITSLYQTIVDKCSESKDYTISKRDLHRSTQRLYKSVGLLDKHLLELAQQERIELYTVRLDSGKTQDRIKVIDSIE